MVCYICVNCGVQYSSSLSSPEHCLMCEDERESVRKNGQEWTTLQDMVGQYENKVTLEEPELYSIHTEPEFGIGQRALLVQTLKGNILWDCISLLDQNTIDRINQLGGISAIAISHPHFFGTMVEWSHQFNNAPIYLHKNMQSWITRADECLHFWDGETKDLFDGQIQLIKTGGHFEGSQVLYWPKGASHKGVLLSGDEPHICMDPKEVAFMHSFPKYIPLNEKKIRKIMERLQPINYDRLYCGVIYSGAGNGVVTTKAKDIVENCLKRYLKALSDDSN